MSRLSSANYVFVVFMKRTGVTAGSGVEERGGEGGRKKMACDTDLTMQTRPIILLDLQINRIF